MPRIANSGERVTEWCQSSGNGSSTHDVCKGCVDDLPIPGDPSFRQLDLYNGDPPGEEWEVGTDHPSYAECDYNCALCRNKLTEEDD
jgi:hypothetical protein